MVAPSGMLYWGQPSNFTRRLRSASCARRHRVRHRGHWWWWWGGCGRRERCVLSFGLDTLGNIKPVEAAWVGRWGNGETKKDLFFSSQPSILGGQCDPYYTPKIFHHNMDGYKWARALSIRFGSKTLYWGVVMESWMLYGCQDEGASLQNIFTTACIPHIYIYMYEYKYTCVIYKYIYMYMYTYMYAHTHTHWSWKLMGLIAVTFFPTRM